nr:BamA/TamA family outer membrane protein [Sediminitomix flava]
MFQSCRSLMDLEENEYILINQKFEGNENFDQESLRPYLKQKEMSSRSALFFYDLGKKYNDLNLEKFQAKVNHYEHLRDSLTIQQEKELFELYFESIDQYVNYLEDENALIIKDFYSHDTVYHTQYETYVPIELYRKDSLKILKKVRKIRKKINDKIDKYRIKIDEGNWVMRSLGKKPVFYNEEAIEGSIYQLSRYYHSNGFFHNHIEYELDTTEKAEIEVNYKIDEGDQFMVRIYDVVTSDTTLLDVINQNRDQSHIQENQAYNQSSLDRERSRIAKLLRNNGYYDFNKSLIQFEVDTTERPLHANVKLVIKDPSDQDKHTQYKVTEITFDSDYDQPIQKKTAIGQYDSISFIEGNNHYSPKVLSSKVGVRKGDFFNEDVTSQTRSGLTNMDIFKFVNVEYEKIGEDSLRASIRSTPFDKFQYSIEGGVNINENLTGPFASLSLKNRNFLNSADIFKLQGNISVDVQTALGEAETTTLYEGGISANFSFPRILFLLPNKFNERLSNSITKTDIQVGYNKARTVNYSSTQLQGFFRYQFQNKRRNWWNFSPLDVSIINADLSDKYRESLEDLPDQTILSSYDSAFLTSMNLFYLSTTPMYGMNKSGKLNEHYLKVFLEYGWNGKALFTSTTGDTSGDPSKMSGYSLYHFFKMYVDYRNIHALSKSTKFAWRFYSGFALPLGTSETLHYSKYFYAGGPSNNRAWNFRELGPGSYTPTTDVTEYSEGEFIITTNLEYRFRIWNLPLEGAVFTDISNVWMLRNNETSDSSTSDENSEINNNDRVFQINDFWKEFGVGAGFGVRLDLSVLIFRVDFAKKVFDPAQELGERFVLPNTSITEGWTLGFGIGYPF